MGIRKDQPPVRPNTRVRRTTALPLPYGHVASGGRHDGSLASRLSGVGFSHDDVATCRLITPRTMICRGTRRLFTGLPSRRTIGLWSPLVYGHHWFMVTIGLWSPRCDGKC